MLIHPTSRCEEGGERPELLSTPSASGRRMRPLFAWGACATSLLVFARRGCMTRV